MAVWRSIALAAVGTAASVVAGPLLGIEPWLGTSVSVLVALFWYISWSVGERDAEEPADRWVLLETYMNLQDAYVTRSALEASDIPCLMPEEHTGGARSDLVFAMQGLRLMVPASELDRARELLAASKGKHTS
jgi:Putative prokaryotic signal transducing protein